jgi:hypothetical protein
MLVQSQSGTSDKKEALSHVSARSGYVPGSEKIISVTDRVVKPAATTNEASQLAANTGVGSSMPRVESSSVKSLDASGSPEPLPASGWTARRPTADQQR